MINVKNQLHAVKSGRERQISYSIAYRWNLEHMVQINLFTKWKLSHKYRKRNSWLPRGTGVRDKLGDQNRHKYTVCVHTCAAHLYPTLRHPVYCSPPGSSVYGISQVRILKWVAISYSRGSSRPRDQSCISCVSCIDRQIVYHCTSWEASPIHSVLRCAQSGPTLTPWTVACQALLSMGILQARMVNFKGPTI